MKSILPKEELEASNFSPNKMQKLNLNQIEFLRLINNGGAVEFIATKVPNFNQMQEELKDHIVIDNGRLELSELGRESLELQAGEGRLDLKELIRITGYISVAERYDQIRPIIYTDTKQWWTWNHKDNYWQAIDETDIMLSLDCLSEWDGIVSPGVKGQLFEALKISGRKRFKRLNKIPNTWIQFDNEIIDIATGNKFDPSPNYFIVNRIPWKIGLSTDAPTIDKLFTDWVGAGQVPLMYELFAYCCLADYPIHRIFCFLGEGRNGKSTAINLLKKFVGLENVIKTDLDRIKSNPRFEMARLDNKLVCLLGEANNEKFDRTDAAKSATGGDPITLEYKGSNTAKTTTLYAKWIMGTNQLPYTTDLSLGYASRWTIIQFKSIFKACKNVLSLIPPEEMENLALKVTTILPELIERGEFTGEKSFDEKMKQIRELSDPIESFIRKNCVEDPDGEVPCFKFSGEFELFCSRQGIRKWSDREISAAMNERGIKFIRKRYGELDNAIRHWPGIVLKDKSVSDVSDVSPFPISPLYTKTNMNIATQATQTTQNTEKSPKVDKIRASNLLFALIKQFKPLEGNTCMALEGEWDKLKPVYDLPNFEELVAQLEKETKIYHPRAGFIDLV
jgi:hypothetical protein